VPKQTALIRQAFADARKLDVMPVNELMALLVKN
jgi:hypothetical protein